jgi:hypothetical protein
VARPQPNGTNLAHHVEDLRIAVDEGVLGWYSPLGTQGGASPRFTERRRFERKKAEVTLQAASRFLGSWQEVRREPVCVRSRTGRYGVHIASIELRAESRVSKAENQDSDARLFAPSSSLYALYMGLGV